MFLKNSILPQANIYSSKILFDNLEDRNQKRIAQIMKRRNALLSKNKNLNRITKDKSSGDHMKTPSTQEISNNTNNSNLDLSKSYIKYDNYYEKILKSSKPKEIGQLLSSFKIKNKNVNSENISRNFNIVEEDSEKEINISNLSEKENHLDKPNDKEKMEIKIKKKKLNKNNNSKTSIDKNGQNEDKNIKEKNKISQKNKYAIEFLSSSLDSFIEIKNKLVRKAKFNKNYFTLSYSQALFLDNNNYNNNSELELERCGKGRIFNYKVNDIIKEENESYSPKKNNKKIKMEQSNAMRFIKRENEAISMKINDSLPNKTFCKSIKKNKIYADELNNNNYNNSKNKLINNCKLKIPKIKLNIELKNKRVLDKNKNNIDKTKKQKEENEFSLKLIKIKPFIEKDNNKKEKNKTSNNNKTKKTTKKVKLKTLK